MEYIALLTFRKEIKSFIYFGFFDKKGEDYFVFFKME